MSYRSLDLRLACGLLGLAIITSCADGSDPAALAPGDPTFASSGPVLVECPVDYEISITGTVDATGGEIVLENHKMAVPPLAVTTPREFRVAAPVSKYMELAINTGTGSFSFEKPVTITIDYSRCSRSNIDKAPLSVWHIDSSSKALLENMGGVDDKDARTVTFQTDHLSTYSIAQ